ncbi:MAG: ATP-grasp domain-containing protein [Lachnospiraceae bacterium]|nr:ATP-grasp domain-containing protein [Lachnospiraceae bacterium]
MKGIILYEPGVAPQREWYINKYISAFKNRGHELFLATTDEIEKALESKPDFAVVRVMAPGISRQLEAAGIRCFNGAALSEVANDKKKSYDFVGKHTDVPFIPYRDNPDYPCVMKHRFGHGGTRVYYMEDASRLEVLQGNERGEFIFQDMCDSPGRDVRVYILGGRIVAAMERKNPAFEDTGRPLSQRFLSNYCLGGTASPYDIDGDREMTGYALSIAKAIPMDLAGIDFIFHEGHPVFNEIEDVVGSRMLYAMTDIDIVEDYADHIIKELYEQS